MSTRLYVIDSEGTKRYLTDIPVDLYLVQGDGFVSLLDNEGFEIDLCQLHSEDC